MKKSSILVAAILLLSACNPKQYYQFSGYAQGGVYNVKYSGIKASPEKVREKVDSLLKEIDFCLSGYNKASELSRFNAGDSLVPSPMFIELYCLSLDWWQKSGGAFDAACAPLFDIWGFGFRQEEMPDEKSISECLANCGSARLISAGQARSLMGKRVCSRDFLRPEFRESAPVELNFNAIAQGYSCDLVAGLLSDMGAEDMLVDIGEIFCRGLNPQGKGWTIGIDNPADGNDTPGKDIRDIWQGDGSPCGVVTSGNYRKFYIREGKKYSHTIDPRNGRPVEHNLLSATVIAPSATDADALATYFMVIGFGQARAYLARHPELKACLITADEVWKNY